MRYSTTSAAYNTAEKNPLLHNVSNYVLLLFGQALFSNVSRIVPELQTVHSSVRVLALQIYSACSPGHYDCCLAVSGPGVL